MVLSNLWRLYLLISVSAAVRAAPQLQFGHTTLTGQALSPVVEFFGRIPYAEPPLGQLRLRSPVLKLQPDVSTLDASDYGSFCIQPRAIYGDVPQSEDCLTINVHRPVGAKLGDKLPVLFWTYGGAWFVGGAPVYNGSQIVEHSVQMGTPIIFVNFNYRLGPLGFPQGHEADEKKILNLGMQDQLAALDWVQANIGLFGGDKKKVTTVGESAGAMMTSMLYLDPNRFEKLARGAILQSGVANSLFTFEASRNEPAWQRFIASVPSCANLTTTGNTLSCLRNAPTDEISLATRQSVTVDDMARNLEWTPTIDGRILHDAPSRLFGKQKLANVPFIAGTNLDEGTYFAFQRGMLNEESEQDMKDYFVDITSDRNGPQTAIETALDDVLSQYPTDPELGSPYGTGGEMFGLPTSYKRVASILGDMIYDGARRLFLQTAAKQGVRSYAYQFTQPQPAGEPALGVQHGADIEYVFGRIPSSAPQSDRDISRDMMDYWISFVVSGDPNDNRRATRTKWPKYGVTNQDLLKLEGGKTEVIKDNYRRDQIKTLTQNSAVFNH